MNTAEKTTFENPSLTFKTDVHKGNVTWQCPSNIALVKYWGKKDIQIPCNPSVSFTLNTSFTETRVEFEPDPSGKILIEFYFENERNQAFEAKIVGFLESI